MPSIPVKNCCGCTACASICPKAAIQMQPDEEGFLQPVVDQALCCECHKCEQVCPILTPPATSATYEACVVAQSKDETVLRDSTSGGFMDALCRYVLEQADGYVCGVAYDAEFLPKHTIVHSYEEAKAFRNSKYAQSELGSTFNCIKNLLKQDKWVLFVGTPCQVAGLRSFLGKDCPKLITADLICRSIPSPKLWSMYLNWQERQYGAKIQKVVCRKKTYGYHSGALEIEFENGKRYTGSNRVDYYMKSFHGDVCSRNSCYDCKFKTEHRCSDFTVFDCWRPELAADGLNADNDKGYSSVLVHSPKGKEILAQLQNLRIYDACAEELLAHTGGMAIKSIHRPEARESFYTNIDRYGFHRAIQQVSKVTLTDRLIEWAKPVRQMAKRFLTGKR